MRIGGWCQQPAALSLRLQLTYSHVSLGPIRSKGGHGCVAPAHAHWDGEGWSEGDTEWNRDWTPSYT